MHYGIILAQEANIAKTYGLDDRSQLKMVLIAIMLVFAIACGIVFTMIAVKSYECNKTTSYNGQAEKPAQMQVHDEKNTEWKTDYYRTLWITNMVLSD